MTTYVLPPGGWLSGAALHPRIGGSSPLHPNIGGNSPLHPNIGGNSPLHPNIGGNTPWNPAINQGQPALDLAAAAARLSVAAPWRGDAPAWTYDDGGAGLLSVAMNRSQARIAHPQDPRRESLAGPEIRGRESEPGTLDSLWRWGAEPRAQAVLANLGWRFAVSDACLWYLIKESERGRRVTFEESLAFDRIPKDKAWGTEQIDKVLRAAVEREERLPEILSQADDFLPFFLRLAHIDATTAPITLELLSIAMRWASPLVMALKDQLAALRPDASSTRVLPVIPTPPHASLPSGHATISALVARLLSQLLYPDEALVHPRVLQFDRLARRIAHNRVVAGVHFPVDSVAGYALGIQLAAHFVGLAEDLAQPARFDLPLGRDALGDLKEDGKPQLLTYRPHRQGGVDTCPPLMVVWNAARRELKQLGVVGASA